jgi:sulfur carrier protein ThiS
VAAALDALAVFFDKYMRFNDRHHALVVAAWVLGTWCYRGFAVFPYLFTRSPEMRSGKSRLLELIAEVGFNASGVLVIPTEAFLFREAWRTGGVQLLDEVDKRLKRNRDLLEALVTVLNAGYARGATVPRLEKRGDVFVPVYYDVYAPRGLAGLTDLAETVNDRSIFLALNRRRQTERVARRTRKTRVEAERLRGMCALACLEHIEPILKAAELAEQELDDDAEVDDRLVSLWVPLLAVAAVADAEDERNRYATLLAFVREASAQRNAEGEASPTSRLIAALQHVLGADTVEKDYIPGDLVKALQQQGFAWIKSTKGLATLLNPMGLFRHRSTKWIQLPGGKRRRPWVYTLEAERLADLAARYGTSEEGVSEEGAAEEGQARGDQESPS